MRTIIIFAISLLTACEASVIMGDDDNRGVTSDSEQYTDSGVDEDGDGFGDSDCDDANPNTYPGADEYCDGVDNDCDGTVDNYALDSELWFFDGDEDGFGVDDQYALYSCTPPDGYVNQEGDCDDDDDDVHPDATEVCDEIDNDCDGDIDAGLQEAWYYDGDGDGYGDADEDVTYACEAPAHHVAQTGDCRDSDDTVYPGAEEICDNQDNDCDDDIDEGAEMEEWHYDGDGDGYGLNGPNNSVYACEQPNNYADESGDCMDNDPDINPDAEEVHGDGVDNNCDGIVE